MVLIKVLQLKKAKVTPQYFLGIFLYEKSLCQHLLVFFICLVFRRIKHHAKSSVFSLVGAR